MKWLAKTKRKRLSLVTLGDDAQVPEAVEGGMEGMQVGSRRRILVTPDRGWVSPDLLPRPTSFFAERRLSERRATQALLIEVELVKAKPIDDTTWSHYSFCEDGLVTVDLLTFCTHRAHWRERNVRQSLKHYCTIKILKLKMLLCRFGSKVFGLPRASNGQEKGNCPSFWCDLLTIL